MTGPPDQCKASDPLHQKLWVLASWSHQDSGTLTHISSQTRFALYRSKKAVYDKQGILSVNSTSFLASQLASCCHQPLLRLIQLCRKEAQQQCKQISTSGHRRSTSQGTMGPSLLPLGCRDAYESFLTSPFSHKACNLWEHKAGKQAVQDVKVNLWRATLELLHKTCLRCHQP